MGATELGNPARDASMPAEVSMQPRRFAFDDLDSIPQYWNANNPLLTHFENAFSILIPPGEQFFIQSVKYYENRVKDPEARELIRAFTEQENLHGEAHNTYNATIAKFGIDVKRQEARAARVFARLQRWLPRRIQLGITVFAEHLTAVGAHTLLDDPDAVQEIHPQMLEFWRWHAAEELEHKAVAFDLFGKVGGRFATRMASVFVAAVLLAPAMIAIAQAMIKEDPHKATPAEREQAKEVQARVMKRQAKLMLAYFRPDFHPWQIDDTELLKGWYREPVPRRAAAQG